MLLGFIWVTVGLVLGFNFGLLVAAVLCARRSAGLAEVEEAAPAPGRVRPRLILRRY